MRFSTALRLGSLNRPQAFGRLYDYHNRGTCALGAAADTILEDIENTREGHIYRRIEEEWPYLKNAALHPMTLEGCHLLNIIYSLNDHHHWTREKIADYVSKLEDKWGIPNPPLDETPPSDVSPLVVEEKEVARC